MSRRRKATRSSDKAGRAYLRGVHRDLRNVPELRDLYRAALEARNALGLAAKTLAVSAQAYAHAVDALHENGEEARPALRPARQHLLDALAGEHHAAPAFVRSADAFEAALARARRRDSTALERFRPLLQAPLVLGGSSDTELWLRFPELSEFVRLGRGPDPLGDFYLCRMWPQHVRARLGNLPGFSRTAKVVLRLGFPGPKRTRDPDNYLGLEAVLRCLGLAGVLPEDWLGEVSSEVLGGGVRGLAPEDGVLVVREASPRLEPEVPGHSWVVSGGQSEDLEGLVRPGAFVPAPGTLAVRFPAAVPIMPLVRNWDRHLHRHQALAELWGASLKGLLAGGLRGGHEWPDLPVQPADVRVLLPAPSWRAGAQGLLRCKLAMNALVLAGVLAGDSFGNVRLQTALRSGQDRVLAFVARGQGTRL